MENYDRLKNAMKSYCTFIFLLPILFSCTSQNPDSKKDESPEDFLHATNAFLKHYENSPQIFTVASDKPSEVVGMNGTILFIDPKDLVLSDGTAIKDSIRVELVELTRKEEFIKHHTTTTSNGELLVSGGMYYINLVSDSVQVLLKDSCTMPVVFPRITDEPMLLFDGKRDSTGRMNWTPTRQELSYSAPSRKPFKQKRNIEVIVWNDTLNETFEVKQMSPEEKEKYSKEFDKKKKVYNETRLSSFGWKNIDYYFQYENRIDIEFTVPTSIASSSIRSYLIFKEINSVISPYTFTDSSLTYREVPEALTYSILAVSYFNKKIYLFYKENQIVGEPIQQLDLVEVTEEYFDEFFKDFI
ncbi:MAG: hypothetical protein IPM71_08175 [Bacteroidota bacterium]|nr:MAG: hypothetical protein IPM71_08175 [Bacteroidota bacterium]